MAITQQLTTNLSQRLHLSQVIEFAHLLAVPDEVFSAVSDAVSADPARTEAVLQETAAPTYIDDKVKNLFTTLIPASENPTNRRGIIITPVLGPLKGYVPGTEVEITPDVLYIGRKQDKPEIIFSGHLQTQIKIEQVQIDRGKYPKTAKFAEQLRHFDDWKRRTLMDAYVRIGEAQREFFEDLKRTRCSIFTYETLAERLGLSPSTLSRLFPYRFVTARSCAGDEKIFPAKDFFVNGTDLQRYIAQEKLNQLFQQELTEGTAYSDRQLAEQATGIAVRTVTKYRLLSNIPSSSERTMLYRSNQRTGPYVME
ncbi:hypothetical protein HYS47_03650 [Candidatus Woesearchaeota archaeon]|nr:hypothetical protein [Candidatus Woesearchaeota archaeon]